MDVNLPFLFAPKTLISIQIPDMNKAIIFLLSCITLLAFRAPAQQFEFRNKWVDSIYNNMSEQERIGQLFMVAAYSGGEKANAADIEKLLKARQIGGVIFMQGTPEAQAKLTNQWQAWSPVKLLIGMDAEWGLGMRLTGVKNFPRQMMIGAAHDTALMYEMGSAVAAQCKRLGVHIDFAPVVDVNNNPGNPVINFRSFGDDKEWVVKLGIAYMNGLQDNGIMACAKHFPGHGDVAVDSHLDLPVVNKTKAQLNDLELYPFQKLIAAGVKSVMVAHLSLPALDTTPNTPSTLSKNIITGLLKTEMGFGGLVFTDALNMKGLTKYYPDGETDLRAFLAGNDVLLFSQNVPLAISKIQAALKAGTVTEADLQARVKKILAAKYDAGLNHFMAVDENNVTSDLNAKTDAIIEKISRAAVTLVKDENKIINKLKSGNVKVAYVNLNGARPDNQLSAQLEKQFPQLITAALPANSSAAYTMQLMSKVKNAGAIIVGVHNLALYPGRNGNYGLDSMQIHLLQKLAVNKNVLFAVMGNAYSLKSICNAKSIIVGYEDDIYTQEAAFEVMTEVLKAKGGLPVKPCK
jgi:beta-N-acetylhexosaminidase